MRFGHDLLVPVTQLAIGGGALFSRGSAAAEKASISLEGATRAQVRVRHGAGRLDVNAGAKEDTLLDGAFGGGVEYRARRNGDVLDVKMRLPAGTFPGPWMWGPGATLDWVFGLNSRIPLALDFEMGASETQLDLTDLRVAELRLKTGASSTQVILPANAGQTRVDIDAGAASVVLRVPAGIAARMRVRGGLSGINVDGNRFPRTGDTFQSADYATASNKVDIDAELGVGSLEVR